LFDTVGILARPDKEEAVSLAKNIATFLSSKGRKVWMSREIASKADKFTPGSAAESSAELLIVIGGDGTILRTCLELGRSEIPMLAINMGTRGFLAEIRPEHAMEAIRKVLAGNYVKEFNAKIEVVVDGNPLPDALNEILITSAVPSKMIFFRVQRDGELLMECRADGLIVATPTGSTAYSLSAGGSILDPMLDAFILTPVCPLVPTRPLAISSRGRTIVDLLKPQVRAVAVVDGAHRHDLKSGVRVILQKSKHRAVFIRLEPSFHQRLKGRLQFAMEE